MQDDKKETEEKAFMKAVMTGIIDLKERRKLTLDEVKERFKIDKITEESI